MNPFMKIVMLVTIILALFFGFLRGPGGSFPFERLHVFLFNLCAGGTLILAHTGGRSGFGPRSASFFAMSLCFALAAYFRIWPAAAILALVLAAICESVRIPRFSFWPKVIFSGTGPVGEKFHAASLLCLSLALVISSAVIVNNEYLGWITAKKLTVDIFFLGFSFPVSLITISLIFSSMKEPAGKTTRAAMGFSFWSVNLGVISFFMFILAEWAAAEFVIACTLFLTVILILYLYRSQAAAGPQAAFLASGMGYLVITALTGIAYIMLPQGSPYAPVVLKYHALGSLYGWNLSGMTVIIRRGELPVGMRVGRIILVHWIAVMALAPLGVYCGHAAAAAAIAAFAAFLCLAFFTGKN